MKAEDCDAMILAGGLGTRLRSVVADRPKVLATVQGRPFLTFLLDKLRQAGCRRVILLTGYQSSLVEAAFGRSFAEMTIVYSPEPKPLGTAGAVRLALPLLSSRTTLLLNGDSFCCTDLGRLLDAHRRAAADATIVLTHVDDSSRYGRVEFDDDLRIRRFNEKAVAGPGWINAGIYAIETDFLATIPAQVSLSLERDLFARDGARLQAYPGGGSFIDIGTPESFSLAERFFTRHAQSIVNPPMVILDRDGTILVEKEYLDDPEGVELLPNAAQGLRILRNLGFNLAVVTNQSGVARGFFTAETLERIHRRMQTLLLEQGVWIDSIYWCPHAPEDHCSCRKPATELGRRAQVDFRFNPSESYVIGDKECDIDFGRRLGARTILVRSGYGKDEAQRGVTADIIADDLLDAAAIIAATDGEGGP